MKGIYQQMQEGNVHTLNEFTKEDLDDLVKNLKIAQEKDYEYRRNRLKELEDNRKYLIKKSKELGKEIPVEVAYHGFLNYNKTYVSSEFLEKYREWIE